MLLVRNGCKYLDYRCLLLMAGNRYWFSASGSCLLAAERRCGQRDGGAGGWGVSGMKQVLILNFYPHVGAI